MVDGVEQLPGDFLGAVHDGFQRGAADQVRQAFDHPTGALVQVAVESAQGAWGVPVQPKCVFEGSDETFTFGGPGKRTGGDQAETAGDLTTSDTGEQATTLDAGRRQSPWGGACPAFQLVS